MIYLKCLLPIGLAFALCGCGPVETSGQCKTAWRLREQIRDMKPVTIDDAMKRDTILSRAEQCDKNPGVIWL